MSRMIPCPNCMQESTKTVLKDQIKLVKSGGIVHTVLVPEYTVNFCIACNDYTIGYEGDDQVTEATKLHTSKPCEC